MKILLIDDEKNILDSVGDALKRLGYDVITSASYHEALGRCDDSVDVALIDVWLPDGDGVELLKKFKSNYPNLVVIMISGHSTIATAVEAVKHGAYDFLEKPLSLDKLEILLQNINEFISLKKQRDNLLNILEGEYRLIGQSKAIEHLLKTIKKYAPEEAPVLISGESGTGKELVARLIHQNSHRKNGPFVAVNCAALPNELAEAELFGFEKGAFTGAVHSRQGRFRRASGGVLFLDEISETSSSLQAKLLRVIEEKKVTPLGGKNELDIDVRIIAASNKDLNNEVKNNRFRQDLFFRLNVLPIIVPPLRERSDDIKILVDYFCEKYANRSNKKLHKLSPSAISYLESLNYPGNIRELKNYVERILILSENNVINVDEVREILAPVVQDSLNRRSTLKHALEEFEREFILNVIKGADGNMARAARSLGIERSHLYKKLKSLGIERDNV